MNQGADIVLPVAGSVGLGAAAAVQQHNQANPNKPVYLIWVDTDGYISAPQYGSLLLTSVVKGIDASVKEAATEALKGTFKGGNYIGTLANNGVAIAPYHDLRQQDPGAAEDRHRHDQGGHHRRHDLRRSEDLPEAVAPVRTRCGSSFKGSRSGLGTLSPTTASVLPPRRAKSTPSSAKMGRARPRS